MGLRPPPTLDADISRRRRLSRPGEPQCHLHPQDEPAPRAPGGSAQVSVRRPLVGEVRHHRFPRLGRRPQCPPRLSGLRVWEAAPRHPLCPGAGHESLWLDTSQWVILQVSRAPPAVFISDTSKCRAPVRAVPWDLLHANAVRGGLSPFPVTSRSPRCTHTCTFRLYMTFVS